MPQVGKRYIDLSDEKLERVGDHWTQMRPLVQGFFRHGGRTRPG